MARVFWAALREIRGGWGSMWIGAFWPAFYLYYLKGRGWGLPGAPERGCSEAWLVSNSVAVCFPLWLNTVE